jgi:hypothetical protein
MVRLPDQRSADRPPTFSHHYLLSVTIDQLDNFKTDALLIPETYIYLLGMQCLDSLFDGLAGYTVPSLSVTSSRSKNPPRVQPCPLDPTMLLEIESAQPGHELCARC